MQQIFTSNSNIQESKNKETESFQLFTEESFPQENPSSFSVQNILNFSKNLEIRKSNCIGVIDYLKS